MKLKCLPYKLYGSKSLLIKRLFIANKTQHGLYPLPLLNRLPFSHYPEANFLVYTAFISLHK
jgi:hypothetical protein